MKNIKQKTKNEIFNYACTNLCQKILKQETARKREKREIEMEMSLWQYYEKEIMFFEKKTDELFTETILKEIKMAKRRKKKLRSSKNDKKQLKNLITSLLKAIAIVETYRYFQILQIVPTEENIQFFYRKREQTFQDLLIIFLSKIERKKKRTTIKKVKY